jgi:serralysin
MQLRISVALFLLASTPCAADCSFGKDQCISGYVWREAVEGDRTCVTPETRNTTAQDNKLAEERRSPKGGDFGPDTCLEGYIWREALVNDHVCVKADTREQAKIDNGEAEKRRDTKCSSANESLDIKQRPELSPGQLELKPKLSTSPDSVGPYIPHANAPPLSVDAPIDLSGIRFEYALSVPGTLPPPTAINTTRIMPDGSVVGVRQEPLAGVPERMWTPGQTIKVRFNGGSEFVRDRVRHYAEEWTQYANIKFRFVDLSELADIHVHFVQNGTSWSMVGRDALLVGFDIATMNFGWFNDSTSEIEFRETTLHEFGHALGLIHEHQSPAAGILWDKPKVYAYFAATQNPPWDHAKVDEQVFEKNSASSTNFSAYDRTSIMHYSFPGSLTTNGIGAPGNTNLSALDKQFIALWYSFPQAAQGMHRTGDDCDEVNFNVEYHAGPYDKVTFTLNAPAAVTWWKAIEIPTKPSGYAKIEVHEDLVGDPATRGKTASVTLNLIDIDSHRSIRFNKAKFLGVHTRLNYAWDVLTGFTGGNHVTLDWNKDHCP